MIFEKWYRVRVGYYGLQETFHCHVCDGYNIPMERYDLYSTANANDGIRLGVDYVCLLCQNCKAIIAWSNSRMVKFSIIELEST